MIALSGEENRKVFFTDRGLNLGQGYVILVGGIPTLQDVKDASRDPAGIVKRLSLLLRQESLKSGTLVFYVSILHCQDSFLLFPQRPHLFWKISTIG